MYFFYIIGWKRGIKEYTYHKGVVELGSSKHLHFFFLYLKNQTNFFGTPCWEAQVPFFKDLSSGNRILLLLKI